jgi:uncharacterized DUF497 family protein
LITAKVGARKGTAAKQGEDFSRWSVNIAKFLDTNGMRASERKPCASEIDFASMEYFDWETAIHQRSDRYGKDRWSSFELIGSRLRHVIWTERGERIRIISLRKANARETVKYVEATT